MHILVTDRLTCPRCGPGFGLILLADDLRERRVHRGALGCSNCRERYPIQEGVADLRPSPRPPLPGPPSGSPGSTSELPDDPEGAMKVGALLGVREGPGLLFLSGGSVRHAGRLAAMVEGIEVIAAEPSPRVEPEAEGVSRVVVGERLPFQSGSVRGAVMEGAAGGALDEALRVLAPGARLVVLDPPRGVGERLEGEGVELLLEAETAIVGARR